MDDIKELFVSVFKEEDVEIKEDSDEENRQSEGKIIHESLEDCCESNVQIKQELPDICSENNGEILEECAMEEKTQPSCGRKCVQNKVIELLEARVGRLECLVEQLVLKVTSSKSRTNTTTSSSPSVKNPITWNNGQSLTSSTNSKTSNSMKSVPGWVATKFTSAIPQSSDGNKFGCSTVEMKSSSSIQQSSVFRNIVPSMIGTKFSSATQQCSDIKNHESAVITTKHIPTIPLSSDTKKLVPSLGAAKSSQVCTMNSNPKKTESNELEPGADGNKSTHFMAEMKTSSSNQQSSVFRNVVPSVIATKSIPATLHCSDVKTLECAVITREFFLKIPQSSDPKNVVPSSAENSSQVDTIDSNPKKIKSDKMESCSDGNKCINFMAEMKNSSSIQQSSVFREVIPSTIATRSIATIPQCSDARNLESGVIITKSVPTIPQKSDVKKFVPVMVTEKSSQVDANNSNANETEHIEISDKSKNVYQKISNANKRGYAFDKSLPVHVDLHPSELLLAVKSGVVLNVQIALINQPTFQQVTEALLMATSDSVVRVLCHYNPNIACSIEASRALFSAAEYGRLGILRTLLEAGTNPNACNINTLTVLHKAASKGRDTFVQILLQHGANISATTNCRCTALHMAAMSGAAKCITVLLKHGADIHEPDSMGCTALHCAVRGNHRTAIKVLLKAGANRRLQIIRGKTLYDLECINTNTVLTYKGANKQESLRSSEGKETGQRTEGPQPETSKILKNLIQVSELEPEKKKKKVLETNSFEKKSSQVGSVNSNTKKTEPVEIAEKSKIMNEKKSNGNKSEFVFDESEPVNVDVCQSGLALAVQTGGVNNVKIALRKQPTYQQVVDALLMASSHNVVRVLCDYNPDVVHSMEASRVLFFAAEFGRTQILKMLLEAGTNPNARDRNSLTVLHKAASGGHETCVRILLHHGANISATTNCKCTALHMAALSGAAKCITVLLENGASVDEPDNMGCTALQYAVRCNHYYAIEALLMAGANRKSQIVRGKTLQRLECKKTKLADEGNGKQENSRSSEGKEIGKRRKKPQPKSSKIMKNNIVI